MKYSSQSRKFQFCFQPIRLIPKLGRMRRLITKYYLKFNELITIYCKKKKTKKIIITHLPQNKRKNGNNEKESKTIKAKQAHKKSVLCL